MAAAAMLNFGRRHNIFGLDEDYFDQIWREDASPPYEYDYVTKKRNRKLIRATSSNERP